MSGARPILLLLAAAWLSVSHAEERPNILVILADDLGIECLPTYGGKSHQTPNIDRLAAQGMRFTHVFSNPYCSPSRASLLTGRYPFRHGVREVLYDWNRHADVYLHADQPSFARQLKAAGYTTAIAGKWHLSFLTRHNQITDFGFDQYQCWQIFREDGTRTRRFHQPHFIRNGTLIADEIRDRYGPDVDVEFLLEFIRTQAEKKRPFLAYHTCLLPHFPWVPTPDSEDQDYELPEGAPKGNPKYFPDMVRYLDRVVGRLVQGVEEAGIADNTVVVFLADNGTDQDLVNAMEGGGRERKIRGGKGSMTDRGTRVPLVVRWPGTVKPGTTCDDLVDFSDLFPTLCQIAGAPLPEATLHGRSFLPQLRGEPGRPRDWVHVQDKSERHLRTATHILDNRGRLRPVVELWRSPAEPIRNETEEDRVARARLQAVFGELGE